MKKKLSFIIAVIMAFGILLPIEANAEVSSNIPLKQAIETVKNAFGLDTTNYNFDYNYNENNNEHKTYDMNWNSKKANQGGYYASVDAETGDILSMNRWVNSTETRSKIPVYTKEQALNAAKALCLKLQPSKFKEMQLKEIPSYNIYSDDIYSTTYSFNFVRMVNNIEFQNNGISISLDKNNLMVMSYNFTWDNYSMPDISKVMNTAAAKKIFSEKIGLELSYNLFYNYTTKEINPGLVYSLKNSLYPIDAITGEILNSEVRYYDKSSMNAGMGGMTDSITPEEQSTVDDASKYISKEKAIETAQKYLPISSKYKLSNISLYTGIIKGTATWNLSWQYNDSTNNTYGYLSASVDAVKGEIRSFSIGGSDYQPSKDAAPLYTKDSAKAAAESFIKGLYSEQFANTEYKDNNYGSSDEEKPQGYNFQYVRKYNNAACPFDYINVYINAYTGKVQNFSMNWTDTSLPSTDGVMAVDNAYSILYSKSDLTLKYIKYYDYKTNSIPQIRLAYVIDNYPGLIDAKNGNILDYNGKPIKEKKNITFTDIKGNAAENSINLLNQLGLLDESSDKFMPNNKITQKDFIKMLIFATVQYYEIYTSNDVNVYDRCYELAIQKKIITEKEKKPEATVARQDAARMAVKALGVGFVANLSNIYTLSLKDIKYVRTAYKGYVAIASELKILVPVKGYFYPTKELTRGDTAIMLVNYLNVNTAE